MSDFIFLCEGELTFLMTSLKDMVKNKGLEVDKCDIGIKHIGSLETLPKGFVVDAEILNGNAESRTYIYDLCIEQGIKLVILGEADEVDRLMQTVSPKIVAAVFKRPVNNQEAADKIYSIWEKIQFDSRKRKILVVDDSPMFLRTVSEWLEKDYTVSICPSATAAFHMIEVKKPDLILLDYEMPVCSGAQFLGMLHSEAATADIPVIFLTSRSDRETVREVISLKPQGYLLKTRPKDEILKTIGDFFEREKGK